MTAVPARTRVIDKRHPGIVGTARTDSDRFSGLVRIDWVKGGSSLVHVSVLAVARDA